ncbi:uncharacterized protein LOC100883602 [Megachile rotundata]|uniref:uncharacterized protein LOC100883602 n=1 Tax=Megachile rotundata TaxID=143995 RepID=UPI003FCF5DFB
MGQAVGRLPNTWDHLLQEKDRVLYWSGEVIARVADNVNEELSFMIDYGEETIDEKVASWIQRNRSRVNRTLNKYPNMELEYRTRVQIELAKIKEEFRFRMRRDYWQAYKDIREFTKKVDKLGKRQRKLHGKLHELETIYDGDIKQFQKKLGLLRLKTFQNLRTGETMMLKDKKLKTDFTKRVCEIDLKNLQDCFKCIDKLIKNIEDTMRD